MKWLVRIIGVLLLFVAIALIALLVLMGIELGAGLAELIGHGWILIVMCVISIGLGVYMLSFAGRGQLPAGKNE